MALQHRHCNTDILQLSSGVSKWIISLCLSSRQLAVLILGSYVLLSLCFRLLNPLHSGQFYFGPEPPHVRFHSPLSAGPP